MTIHGDGSTDDTEGFQTALRLTDLIVAPGTYAIAENVSIPTGRNIYCQHGATFLDTQSKSTRMFQIGSSSASTGNNSITGCHFQGTDLIQGRPGTFANYKGGTSGYSELFEITSGWGVHTDHVLLENNKFSDPQGDGVLTYSPCGTKNTGIACNNGVPGTEGPSNIFVVHNTFEHCAQPGFNANGGQNIVVTQNTFIDCNNFPEVDAPVLQVIQSWWYDNLTTAQFGTYDPLNGQIYGPSHDCAGNTLLPEDNSQCYSFNNRIDGVAKNGRPAQLLKPTGVGCLGIPGHYFNDSLTNGAVLNMRC